jgi:5-methylthioribose kinase
LLGIIAVTVLPTISSVYNNFNILKDKMEMIYIGEMVVEKIKAFNDDYLEDDYIFDMKLHHLIEELRLNDSVKITLPREDKEFDYYCTILKNGDHSDIWELHVTVYPKEEESRLKNVEYKVYLPKK